MLRKSIFASLWATPRARSRFSVVSAGAHSNSIRRSRSGQVSAIKVSSLDHLAARGADARDAVDVRFVDRIGARSRVDAITTERVVGGADKPKGESCCRCASSSCQTRQLTNFKCHDAPLLSRESPLQTGSVRVDSVASSLMRSLARRVGGWSLVGLVAMMNGACSSGDGGGAVAGSSAGGGAGSGSSAGGGGTSAGGAIGASGAGVGGAISGGIGGAMSGGAGTGVAGSGSGAKSYCETLRAKERSCGILGEGKTACADFYDAAEPCEIDCMERATCADIIGYYCATGTTALGTCYSSCVGLAPLDCGDGSKIPGWGRCNGVPECEDGSDEVGCDSSTSRYKCRNVDQFIALEKLCDGTKDCSDSSDENAECTERTCKVDGVNTQVPFFTTCDGTSDCDDASDEPADCAVRSCPN